MQKTMIRRFTSDKIAWVYECSSNKLFANYRRGKLNNTDFSIISNNCWGGHVYRHFGLSYTSPTVGLYFYADEYIKFLSELEHNLNSQLQFIDCSESKYADDLKRKGQENIPIGLLNGSIEVMFLHYATKEEAYEKWMRRLERINYDNLIVKFSEMNRCSREHLEAFDNLPFKKKVVFLANPDKDIKCGIPIKRYTNGNEVTDDTTYFDKNLELLEFINGGGLPRTVNKTY